MADGKTHTSYYTKGWKTVYPLSISISVFLIFKYDPLFGIAFFPFSLLNYKIAKYVTPDSDLMGLTIGEWDILDDFKKKFGWLGGLFATVWNAWWMIYAYICGKHRSWYSHGWFIGTIGRMIHFNFPIALFAFTRLHLDKNVILSSDIYANLITSYLLSQFITWYFADSIHLVLDSEWAKGRLYTPSRFKNTNKF